MLRTLFNYLNFLISIWCLLGSPELWRVWFVAVHLDRSPVHLNVFCPFRSLLFIWISSSLLWFIWIRRCSLWLFIVAVGRRCSPPRSVVRLTFAYLPFRWSGDSFGGCAAVCSKWSWSQHGWTWLNMTGEWTWLRSTWLEWTWSSFSNGWCQRCIQRDQWEIPWTKRLVTSLQDGH